MKRPIIACSPLVTALLCSASLFTETSAAFAETTNRVLSLNGSSAYVNIPSASDLQNPTELTVEAWVYPTNGAGGYFIAKGDGGSISSARSYELCWRPGSGNNIEFDVFLGASTWAAVGAPLPAGRWSHFAGTYSTIDSTLRIYVNGVLKTETTNDASATIPLNHQTVRQTTLPVTLGGYATQGIEFIAGRMDEVRIWTKARSQQEIAGTMHARLTGTESNLAGYWNFDDGTANDVTGHGHSGTFIGGAESVELAGADVIHPFKYSGQGSTCVITSYLGDSGVVEIPSTLDGFSVVGIGSRAFYLQTNLTSVTIPNTVTSIGDAAFGACFKLGAIVFPNTLTNIGQLAFADCYSLSSVAIPASVAHIGEGAFAGNVKLMSINVEPGNASYVSVDGILFNDARTTLVQYPAGKVGAYAVPSGVTRIGGWAFDITRGLNTVNVPQTVTSIGEAAFSDCTGLTTVTLPASVNQIQQFAFGNCHALTNALFQGNAPAAPQNLFYRTATNMTVYYLEGTTGWGPTFGGVNAVLLARHAATASGTTINGFLVAVGLTDNGWGYTNTPLVRIIGGGGTGAQAVAVISNGVVTAVNVLAAGSGYTNKPVVVIAPPYIPQPKVSITAFVFGPMVNPVMKLDFANLSPYDNYQIEFKSDADGLWSDLGVLFTPTASTNTQYATGVGSHGFFRARYVK